MAGPRPARLLPGLALAGLPILVGALFLRSYTVPPAPDRRGGTALRLTWPDRPLFGSPRADCLGPHRDEPAVACLIASVNRARGDGIGVADLPFCGPCYALSDRLASAGPDEAAARARRAEIARFGW